MMGSNIHEPDGRDLDGLLDRALTSYTPAQARAGLEQRVMARIDAEPDRRGGGWGWRAWLWTAGCAVAGLAVCVAGVPWQEHRILQERPAERAASAAAPVSPVPPVSAQRPASVQGAVLRVRREVSGRQPSRQPTQEQLIAQLLAMAPQAVSALGRSEDEDPNVPIHIEPLHEDQVVVEPVEVRPVRIEPINDEFAQDGAKF